MQMPFPAPSPGPSQMKHRSCVLFPDFPGCRGQTPDDSLRAYTAGVTCPLAGEGTVVIEAPSPSEWLPGITGGKCPPME